MSILPNSASFGSFFVVLAISFLLTILLGVNLPTLLSKLFRLTHQWSPRDNLSLWKHRFLFKRPEWTRIDYIQGYVDILNPTIDLDSSLSAPKDKWGLDVCESWIFLLSWRLFRQLPILVLHYFLANEVNFPFYQWWLYQHRHDPRMVIKYHWAFFIKDLIRFFLLPIWFVIGGATVFYLVIQDILGLFLIPLLRPILGFVLPILEAVFVVIAIPFVACGTAVYFVWDKILKRLIFWRSNSWPNYVTFRKRFS